MAELIRRVSFGRRPYRSGEHLIVQGLGHLSRLGAASSGALRPGFCPTRLSVIAVCSCVGPAKANTAANGNTRKIFVIQGQVSYLLALRRGRMYPINRVKKKRKEKKREREINH